LPRIATVLQVHDLKGGQGCDGAGPSRHDHSSPVVIFSTLTFGYGFILIVLSICQHAARHY
jgi:hypothetical protein